jgi:2-keto-4-pentenoate hydratase/2-oxohepta-3-ene-1,7-dioic acid hydratase in catechol pathway
MTFLTYLRRREPRLGMLAGDESRIVDVVDAATALRVDAAPATMLELVDGGDAALSACRAICERTGDLPEPAFADPDVRIVAPIPRPRKNIFAVGLNYVRHNKEFTGSDRLPNAPIVFTKAPTSVVGPGDAITLRPDLSPEVDYEGELGVVIGTRGRDIPVERAEQHIFGYTIVNDVTARDLQKRTSQWFLGKSLDTFCPMGPYLVHKSVVGWPVRLEVKTTVNGEVRQRANSELLYFDIPKLIATISSGITLEPGDIIATGTPEGVGMGFDPPKFLRSGDVVEIEIEKLGRLRNPVT